MPILKKVIISNFRNIEFQDLDFSPNINCISGNNGEGKTNLLDAIYYLSMTKSAFLSSDKFNLRHDSESFVVSGKYLMENTLESKFAISVSDKGEKKLKRDEKPYKKVSEHIGVLPVVMVSPADTVLVSEYGEERRKFVNSVLSQMDKEYLTALQQYNRLLLQRNKMLKEYVDGELISVIDMQMSSLAESIYKKRKIFATNLSHIVGVYYRSLSGGEEDVKVEYKSDIQNGALQDLLSQKLERDILLKYTSVGIHRDDFIFTIDNYPIRRYGSQGQQKSFLVALKFAQYDIMKMNYGYPPLLLLDDIFDKLDMGRTSNLLSMVSSQDFGQIFITDSNKVRMSTIVDGFTDDRAYFEAVGGKFNCLDDVQNV